VGHGLCVRQRGTCETGDACSTARCGAWFTWEATWDTRDGRCVLDHPLWGMVYMGGNVGCARWAVRAQPPVVGRGLHEGVGGAKQRDGPCCLGRVLREIGFEGVRARRSVGERGLGGVWRL